MNSYVSSNRFILTKSKLSKKTERKRARNANVLGSIINIRVQVRWNDEHFHIRLEQISELKVKMGACECSLQLHLLSPRSYFTSFFHSVLILSRKICCSQLIQLWNFAITFHSIWLEHSLRFFCWRFYFRFSRIFLSQNSMLVSFHSSHYAQLCATQT